MNKIRVYLDNCCRFDYTKWQEKLFENMSIEEIIEKGRQFAVDFRKIKGNIKNSTGHKK